MALMKMLKPDQTSCSQSNTMGLFAKTSQLVSVFCNVKLVDN